MAQYQQTQHNNQRNYNKFQLHVVALPLPQVLHVYKPVPELPGELKPARFGEERLIEIKQNRFDHFVIFFALRGHVIIQANEFPKNKKQKNIKKKNRNKRVGFLKPGCFSNFVQMPHNVTNIRREHFKHDVVALRIFYDFVFVFLRRAEIRVQGVDYLRAIQD